MQKSIIVFLLLSTLVLTLSNFTQRSKKEVIIFAINDAPKLPEIPFPYSDTKIPDHLMAPEPNQDIGYGASVSNSNDKLDIEDDIATLGRVLFYDVKLSALENISCATCHKQELSFADDTTFSQGITTPTKRNSMALNDLFWSNRDHFLWDMKVTDLNEMIRIPLKDENEIGADLGHVIAKLESTTYYPDLFSKAYGSTMINEDKIVDALIHFISSMTTFESKFDKQVEKEFVDFTEKEIVGLELFSENCTVCHSQGTHDPFDLNITFNNTSPMFFFPEIFNNGLPSDPNDKGAGEHDPLFSGLFKIPTLRNVDYTAPYMHDGRFGTLEEVIEHYSSGVISNNWTTSKNFVPDGGFQFTDFEKESLVAFLKTLRDENLTTHRMWSDPFDPLLSNNYVPFDRLVVMPNPMIDQAIIEFENKGNAMTLINILTMSGQLIKSDKTADNRYVLDKTIFESGTYIIEVIQENKKSVQKVVVR
jgi:cytochrome c peroxidase